MNKNGVIAVVVVVVSVVLVGLWAMRSEQGMIGVDCSSPPSAPANVTASVEEGRALLHWDPPPPGEPVTTYIIEAGSAPGANNQGTFVAPASSTTYQREAPPGTYYVRMFARNACGTGPPSQELTVVLP